MSCQDSPTVADRHIRVRDVFRGTLSNLIESIKPMSNYSYEAVDSGGLKMEGVLDVIDQNEAIRRVKRTDPTDTKSDRDKRVHGQMISAAIRVYKTVGDKTEYDK